MIENDKSKEPGKNNSALGINLKKGDWEFSANANNFLGFILIASAVGCFSLALESGLLENKKQNLLE